MAIETILCDVYGVLADFHGAALRCFGMQMREYASIEPMLWKGINISEADFWEAIRTTPEFWATLPVYPWTQKVYGTLTLLAATRGTSFTLLFGESRMPDGREQREKWIRKNLSRHFSRYHMGADKLRCVSDEARPYTLLIDDNPNVCRRFREAGGNALLFPHALNKFLMRPDDVPAWFEAELKTILRGDLSKVGPRAAKDLPELEQVVTS